MNVLDLFSGIGGFSLGLERAGMRTVAFCEVNEWCRRLLKKHWPSIPIMKDVTKLGIEPMSSWEDSPARTSATQASAPALPEAVPLYGGGFAEPFAWFDPSTLSWRTWQRCLITGWTSFAETWPRSGMTRNGIAYRLPTLVPLTGETASGLWQTPVADDAVDRTIGKFNSRGEPKLSAQVKLWPTPRAADGATSNLKFPPRPAKGRLEDAVANSVWPTPRASDAERGGRGDLIQAVRGNPNNHYRTWPTPTAVTNSGGAALCKWGGAGSREKLRSMVTPEELNGALNPTWVEWLMGYPLGWTDSVASVMRSSRKSRKSSGEQS